MLAIFSLAVLLAGASAQYRAGPEYWSDISKGQISSGAHSESDFLTFDGTHGWVAYWNDPSKREDIFGHALRRGDGQICGFFARDPGQFTETCTGFRILSVNQHNPNEGNPFHFIRGGDANEHRSIGFNHHFIGRLEGNHQFFYGDALLASPTGHAHFLGVDPDNTHDTTEVSDQDNFNANVWILQKS